MFGCEELNPVFRVTVRLIKKNNQLINTFIMPCNNADKRSCLQIDNVFMIVIMLLPGSIKHGLL